MTIHGITDGLPAVVVKKLELLSKRKSQGDYVISIDVARLMTDISNETGRMVATLLSRRGEVEYLIIGTPDQVVIPVLSRFKLIPGRLRGLRLVRTDPLGKSINDDDLTDLSLLRLDSVSAIGYDNKGEVASIKTAHLMPEDSVESFGYLDDRDIFNQRTNYVHFIEALDDEIVAKAVSSLDINQKNKAVLTGCYKSKDNAQISMDELTELARSAEISVVSTITQVRQIDPKYVVGSGKLKDIIIKALSTGSEYIVFDNELSPSQSRAISEFTELKILDRTQLILDIFARRAKSNEGKLRVEIAQLKYMLPRLSAKDDALSRLSGGIGGRGPGETRLEVDKRRISDRIAFLTGKLKKIENARNTQRLKRKKNEIPIVSIIGYTNAGKSTLINSMTKSDVYADNLLFATLETSAKRIRFPRERDVIVTDTVGFIRDLPKQLAGAFKSTLEELNEADLFLHVIDISDKNFERHIKSVDSVIEDMKLQDKERILVFNKCDKISDEELEEFKKQYEKAVFLSALDRKTFTTMLEKIYYFFYKEGIDFSDDMQYIAGYNGGDYK